MLPIPSDPNLTVSVVGIDPGTEMLGVAAIYFNLTTFQILKINATTFRGSKLPGSEWTSIIHSDRVMRLQSHRANLINLLNEINPIAISVESPFYTSRMPSAFGALTEVVAMIRSAVLEYDVWRRIYLVDPPNVKKALGAKGNADKLEVKQALVNMPELSNVIVGGLDSLDEHSIDAIAVALHLYIQYRDSTVPVN